MIYTVSDIHGCYDKYIELLKKIDLGHDDTLYVLGDVIDRGSDGFKVMLDMAQRPNVVGQMGNHEAMAIQALPGIMRTVQRIGKAALSENEVVVLNRIPFTAQIGMLLSDILLSSSLLWKIKRTTSQQKSTIKKN